MYYQVSENHIATEEQTIIKSKPFMENMIDVFRNGEKLTIDEDYTYNNEDGEITFISPLVSGELVSLLSTSDDVDKAISFGSKDTNNALFKRYDSDKTLNYNNKYKVHIVIDNQPYEYTFSSELSPFFSTSKKIFEDVGEFIDGYTEEYVNSIIHRNSIEIMDKINSKVEDNETDGMAVTEEIISDTDGYYESPSKLINKWVRLKTDIDLIYARYYGIAANYGSEEKSIGDIRIARDRKLPYIDELLKKLKKDLQDTENKIFGVVIAQSAVRAGTNYPYSERGSW